MSDVIKLPSGVEVYPSKSLRIPGLGTVVPVGDLTPAEVQALRDDVADAMNKGLVDLSDVDTAGDTGMVLAKQEDGTFAFENVPGSLAEVGQNWGSPVPVFFDIHSLRFRPGIYVEESSANPGLVLVGPVFGNAADTIAEGDHTHTQPMPVRVTTAPSGYMSGGSRSLGSTSVTLASGITYIVEAEVYGQFRGADPGAAYYTLSLTIDGNTFTSPGGSDGFWCVQGVPDKARWKHERQVVGTGASIPVSASVAWHSGSGFNVDRMYLDVRLRPNR